MNEKKSNGLHTEWYENGQKKREETFKDDKEDGLHTKWYVNGQKSSKWIYKDGETISSEHWNKNGSPGFY